MNENVSAQPTAIPPPRPKRRWLTVLLFAGVFLCGIVFGSSLSAVVILRGIRQAIQHPEGNPDRATRWLARRLKLTPEQRAQAHKILVEQNADFTALRREVQPRVIARLEQTEQEIAKILKPDQQQKWQDMVKRLRERWLPGLPAPPEPKPPAP